MIRLAIAAIALVVLAATSPARADDASEAEAEYRLGYKALSAGDCEQALVHYARSLELARRPRTLFNIASCQEQLGQDEDAWTSYHTFLELAEERDLAIVSKARKRVEVLRARLRGTVSTRSDPPGAAVTVDAEHEARGTTPLTLSLPPGAHVLRFAAEGRDPVERTVEIQPGRSEAVEVALRLPARVRVTVEPADATIAIDGAAPRATGELDLEIGVGRHEITVQREGYRTSELTIDAAAGHVYDEHVALRPERPVATLAVATRTGADVTVDGEGVGVVGAGALEIFGLRPGQHRIRVAAPGSLVWQDDVHLSGDELVRVDVTLPSRPSRARVAAGWTAAAVGALSLGAGITVGAFALRDAAVADADVQDRGEARAWIADGLVAVGAVAVVAAWRLLRAHHATARVLRAEAAP